VVLNDADFRVGLTGGHVPASGSVFLPRALVLIRQRSPGTNAQGDREHAAGASTATLATEG